MKTPAATLGEETERWKAGVRTAVKRSREQALQLELGVRGEEAIETVIEPKDVVEGMTEEEAKRWRAFLKPKAGGGKVKGGKAKPMATATSGGGAQRRGERERSSELGRLGAAATDAAVYATVLAADPAAVSAIQSADRGWVPDADAVGRRGLGRRSGRRSDRRARLQRRAGQRTTGGGRQGTLVHGGEIQRADRAAGGGTVALRNNTGEF